MNTIERILKLAGLTESEIDDDTADAEYDRKHAQEKQIRERITYVCTQAGITPDEIEIEDHGAFTITVGAPSKVTLKQLAQLGTVFQGISVSGLMGELEIHGTFAK